MCMLFRILALIYNLSSNEAAFQMSDCDSEIRFLLRYLLWANTCLVIFLLLLNIKAILFEFFEFEFELFFGIFQIS